MIKNIGNLDKVIRIFFAIVIGVIYFSGLINGVTAIFLLALASILFFTSVIGACPLYQVFGISTKKVNDVFTLRSKKTDRS
jgi:DUF2892 family protein